MTGRLEKQVQPVPNHVRVEHPISHFQGWLLPPRVRQAFGDPRFRLEGTLLALHLAQDGQAWSVEEPGILRHWLLEPGRELSRVGLSDFEILWTFSPKQNYLASAGNEVSIWDYNRGELITSFRLGSWVNAMTFSPDGRWLATGHDDGEVRLWDVVRNECTRSWQANDVAVSALRFSPDGQQLAAADEQCSIHLWQVLHGMNIGHLEGHTDRISDLAWHPDGRHLASSGWDTSARLWDTATGKCLYLLNGHSQQVQSVQFSPTGRRLATVDSRHTIWLWDPFVGKVIHRLRGHRGEVTCMAFTPTGRELLTGGEDGRLMLWDVERGKPLNQASESLFNTVRLSVHPGGDQLVGVAGGRDVHIWSHLQGEVEHRAMPSDSEATAILHDADGAHFFTGHASGLIQVWDSRSLTPVRQLSAHRFGITALSFDPHRHRLASAGGGDGYVYVWNPEQADPLLLIPEAAQGGTVEDVAFVPGKPWLVAAGVDWLCSGASDGTIQMWDYERPARLLQAAHGAIHLAIHPQGQQLAAALLTDSIGLFDVFSMEMIQELEGHQGRITALAYSPDGRWLISGGEDGLLRVWNLESGRLQTFLELDVPIRDVVWPSHGHFLYTANANTTFYLVDLSDAI